MSQRHDARHKEANQLAVFHASLGNIKPGSELEIRIPFALIAGANQTSASPVFNAPALRHPVVRDLNRGSSTSRVGSVNVPENTGTAGLTAYPVSINLGSPAREPTGKFRLSKGSVYPHEFLEKEAVITISPQKLDPTLIEGVQQMETVCDLNLLDQDYQILVDRSSSMSGTRIAQARKALKIMVKSIPDPPTITYFVSHRSVYH